MTRIELLAQLGLRELTPRSVLERAFGAERVRCLPENSMRIMGQQLIDAGLRDAPGESFSFNTTRGVQEIAIGAIQAEMGSQWCVGSAPAGGSSSFASRALPVAATVVGLGAVATFLYFVVGKA